MKKFQGIAASFGIAKGHGFCYRQNRFTLKEGGAIDRIKEQNIFKTALERVGLNIRQSIEETRKHIGPEEAAIFEAHLMMLEDPDLIESIQNKINDGHSAFNATLLSFDEFIRQFHSMQSEYMKERAQDLQDIRQHILTMIEGKQRVDLRKLPKDTILMADDLMPSDIAMLRPEYIAGFVTKTGGKTSHIAIMARTLGVPAIVGISDLPLDENVYAIIDGEEGTLILSPSEEVLTQYTHLQERQFADKKRHEIFASASTKTKSGKHFDLAANIGSPKDLDAVLATGAEGIGLFRTEFLFMDRPMPPNEEEQMQAYTKVLCAFPSHRVVIRTLDIGGDKQIPYMDFPEELNPFLGYRAIRYCLDHPILFKTQLRALLRASVHGNLCILLPMVSSVEEILAVRKLLQEVQEGLTKEALSFNEKIELGIMIELPHAALISDILAEHVDFFSIGTNDLIQYTLAVDRLNAKLSNLYSPYQPGTLRLIAQVVKNAKKKRIWVGICGEAASDVALLPFWLGLGLDELSMSSSSILKIRALASEFDERCFSELAQNILKSATQSEVLALLKGVSSC